MTDPLGGDAGGPEAPTTYLEDVDDSPLEVMTEVWERPPTILKMLMADPERRCRRSESTHHLS
jgi:hypothetical protein